MSTGYTQRSSSTELPGAAELLDILAKESPRKARRFDYLTINLGVFDAHGVLANQAGTDNQWIHSYPSMPLDKLAAHINDTHGAITSYINQHQNNDLYERVFSALIPELIYEKSDAIFVFGSKTNARIERAVELYHEHFAPKIILSGRSPHYSSDTTAEADRMAQYARDAGVPAADIIVEPTSITLPDNVKRTLDAMEPTGWQPKSLTIVATNFVLQRAVMEWYKFTPWNIVVYPVAARTASPHFQSATWHQNPSSVALVLNEYAKLVLESKIDLMRRDQQL